MNDKKLIQDAILNQETSINLSNTGLKDEDIKNLVENCQQLTKMDLSCWNGALLVSP